MEWRKICFVVMLVGFMLGFAFVRNIVAINQESVITIPVAPDIKFDHYHHHDELMSLFNELAENYSSYARVGSIGKSVNGRDLYYLEITENVQFDSPSRPKVKYVGNMHGDETVGRELIIFLSQYLLYNHDSDKRCHEILTSMRLFLMPTMNPDGFEDATEGSCSTPRFGGHRENAHQKDLNRNFPDQFDSQYITKTRHFEPETKEMMEWITNNKYDLIRN